MVYYDEWGEPFTRWQRFRIRCWRFRLKLIDVLKAIKMVFILEPMLKKDNIRTIRINGVTRHFKKYTNGWFEMELVDGYLEPLEEEIHHKRSNKQPLSEEEILELIESGKL